MGKIVALGGGAFDDGEVLPIIEKIMSFPVKKIHEFYICQQPGLMIWVMQKLF